MNRFLFISKYSRHESLKLNQFCRLQIKDELLNKRAKCPWDAHLRNKQRQYHSTDTCPLGVMFFHQLNFIIHIKGKQETFVPKDSKVKSFSFWLPYYPEFDKEWFLLATSVDDYIYMCTQRSFLWSFFHFGCREKVGWTDGWQSMDKIAY